MKPYVADAYLLTDYPGVNFNKAFDFCSKDSIIYTNINLLYRKAVSLAHHTFGYLLDFMRKSTNIQLKFIFTMQFNFACL